MIVNGLPLPRELIALITAGWWRCPTHLAGVDRLFPDRGELCLYSVGLMQSESAGFPVVWSTMWLGEPDPEHPPGDIDPRRMVIIADLGIGYDQPIALDYRLSLESPRVLTLQWSARGHENRWIEIAPDFETFARLIGL
jgi:hypothetical protein